MIEYNDSPFIKYCRRRPSNPGGENEWGEDAEKEGLAEEETPIHVTTEAGPATGNQEELEEKALGNVSTLYHHGTTMYHTLCTILARPQNLDIKEWMSRQNSIWSSLHGEE